jgi:hypothetical protein
MQQIQRENHFIEKLEWITVTSASIGTNEDMTGQWPR